MFMCSAFANCQGLLPKDKQGLLCRLHKMLLQIVGLLKITHDEARSLKEQTLGTRAVW